MRLPRLHGVRRRLPSATAILVLIMARSVVPEPLAAAQGMLPEAWNRLESAPVGAQVRLKFVNGGEIEGRLVEAPVDAIVLNQNRVLRSGVVTTAGRSLRETHSFSRTDVVEVTVTRESLRPEYYVAANSAPHPGHVRTIVGALKLGIKVDVHTSSSRLARSTLLSTDERGFTVTHDGRSLAISYSEVREVRPSGKHWATKVAIPAAVIGVGYLSIVVLGYFYGGA